MNRILVEKDCYYDSVFLMSIGSEVRGVEGVTEAVVSLGTEVNRELLRDLGFSSPELQEATGNDLVIAVAAAEEEVLSRAVGLARELLTRKRSAGGGEEGYRPVSLEGAIRMEPRANLVIVSVPGRYAAREARKALERGLHVMLFSDNVSLAEEIALKGLAASRGLLLMGPDCGTAVINGKPLGFANAVRRGGIGLVAASGTGLQEVICLIHRLGEGISQAIGTGGRDLSPQVGGVMTLLGIDALRRDPATRAIVVVSKPPAEEVAARVVSALAGSGKPCAVHFVGADPGEGGAAGRRRSVRFTTSLQETAQTAVALLRAGSVPAGEDPYPGGLSLAGEELDRLAGEARSGMSGGQRFLRGLFSGGTLADEALFLMERQIGGVYSNNQPRSELRLPDPRRSRGHSIVDLGADEYTRGRAHPMIDPTLRVERIRREMADPEVAVLLLDCVLGYGCHPDPAGAMSEALAQGSEMARSQGRRVAVVASVTGTEGDPQGLDGQRRTLEAAGARVLPSNYQAALLALRIVEKASGGEGG